MVQAWNWPAIRTTARVLLKPSLAMPHVEVTDIRQVDFMRLRASGCEGVVFDKDNTITAPYADFVAPHLLEALHECRDAFDGRVAVLSNSVMRCFV